MRRVLPLKIALASLLVAACVTINVYFPAAAADKAADQVINDITGGGAKSGTTTPPQGYLVPSESADRPNFLVAAFGNALYALVPTANAQDADAALNVSSPAVTRIKQSMGARFGELEKFYASGAIGLTKDGMVDVRDLNAVQPSSAWCPRTTPTARSSTRRLPRPATTRSGKPTSRRALRNAGSPRAPSPAGTTRATTAPGNRSNLVR